MPPLTDEQITAILLSDRRQTAVAVARQLGLTHSQVQNIRQGSSKRGLRLASKLGLEPRRFTRTCFNSTGNVIVCDIASVAVKAHHMSRSSLRREP